MNSINLSSAAQMSAQPQPASTIRSAMNDIESALGRLDNIVCSLGPKVAAVTFPPAPPSAISGVDSMPNSGVPMDDMLKGYARAIHSAASQIEDICARIAL